MENEGALKPVEVSDWATRILCVPKTDRSVRICGGYKGTDNPAFQTEQFSSHPDIGENSGKGINMGKVHENLSENCISATSFGPGVTKTVYDQHA